MEVLGLVEPSPGQNPAPDLAGSAAVERHHEFGLGHDPVEVHQASGDEHGHFHQQRPLRDVRYHLCLHERPAVQGHSYIFQTCHSRRVHGGENDWGGYPAPALMCSWFILCFFFSFFFNRIGTL